MEINGKTVILREYDRNLDPPKLVKYLFDKMNSEEGIKELIEGDKHFDTPNEIQVRLVAEIEGELVATTEVKKSNHVHTPHLFTLYSVVTAPNYQGTGLSKLLFEFVCAWIKEHHGKLLLVDTWENNIPARKFYEKMGFIQYGQLPKGIKERDSDEYVDNIFYYMNLDQKNSPLKIEFLFEFCGARFR